MTEISLSSVRSFNGQSDYAKRNCPNYSVGIHALNMTMDDRTKWVSQHLSSVCKRLITVSYCPDKTKLSINGIEYEVLDFIQHLKLSAGRPLIDSTSLSYPEVQYLILELVENGIEFDVIYVEPANYKKKKDASPAPNDEELFDLSNDGSGLLYLPPFFSQDPRSTLTVISIGFEGHRVAGLLKNDELSDPGMTNVRIVLGMPPFKAGFDRVSLKKNNSAIEYCKGIPDFEICYASASNAFSMFQELNRIKRAWILPDQETRPRYINLVPFGTKPSAIGMALFASKNRDISVVTYDHVEKKTGRSEGVGKIHLMEFR